MNSLDHAPRSLGHRLRSPRGVAADVWTLLLPNPLARFWCANNIAAHRPWSVCTDFNACLGLGFTRR